MVNRTRSFSVLIESRLCVRDIVFREVLVSRWLNLLFITNEIVIKIAETRFYYIFSFNFFLLCFCLIGTCLDILEVKCNIITFFRACLCLFVTIVSINKIFSKAVYIYLLHEGMPWYLYINPKILGFISKLQRTFKNE